MKRASREGKYLKAEIQSIKNYTIIARSISRNECQQIKQEHYLISDNEGVKTFFGCLIISFVL